jgi:hypothetical protein
VSASGTGTKYGLQPVGLKYLRSGELSRGQFSGDGLRFPIIARGPDEAATFAGPVLHDGINTAHRLGADSI